ncbi:unnamed protein product [Urochloa humidicola]
MDDPKRIEAAAAGLPDHPLAEILSRLPAKPLFRFKCVSKGWCDLISGRLGRRRFPQTLEGFLFVGSGGGVNHGHFIDLSGRSVPLVDAAFSFLTKLPGIENLDLLSANNGLILFGQHFRDSRRLPYKYIVCNPATEQWVSVPSSVITPYPPVEGHYYSGIQAHTFLIFDPAVSSHFQLLQFWYGCCYKTVRAVRVFSSETGVWRDVEGKGMRDEDEVQSKLGSAIVNGMLHIPVYRHYLQSQTKDIHIAVVDMQGKKNMAFHWPDMNESAAVFIGQSQGHLHCITGDRKQEDDGACITELSIWVLEDYDAAQEDNDAAQWALKQSVSCLQLFGEISCGVGDFDVVAIHPDRNLVFFVHRYNWKLMSYDMDSEEVCDLCTLGHGRMLIIPYVPYFAEVPVLNCGAPTGFLEGQPTIL